MLKPNYEELCLKTRGFLPKTRKTPTKFVSFLCNFRRLPRVFFPYILRAGFCPFGLSL